jgi:tetratricopeptide (TPR) repeat protein
MLKIFVVVSMKTPFFHIEPVSSTPEPEVYLLVFDGLVGSASRSYSLLPSTYVIGKDPSCSIPLGHASVSKEHARLTAVEDAWRLEDLGSTNGTWVNNERIQNVFLHSGDILRFGVGGQCVFVRRSTFNFKRTVFPVAFARKRMDEGTSVENKLRSGYSCIELGLRIVVAAMFSGICSHSNVSELNEIFSSILIHVRPQQPFSLGMWFELACKLSTLILTEEYKVPSFLQDSASALISTRGRTPFCREVELFIRDRNEFAHSSTVDDEISMQGKVLALRKFIDEFAEKFTNIFQSTLVSNCKVSEVLSDGISVYKTEVFRGPDIFPKTELRAVRQTINAGNWCSLISKDSDVLCLAPFWASDVLENTSVRDLFCARSISMKLHRISLHGVSITNEKIQKDLDGVVPSWVSALANWIEPISESSTPFSVVFSDKSKSTVPPKQPVPNQKASIQQGLIDPVSATQQGTPSSSEKKRVVANSTAGSHRQPSTIQATLPVVGTTPTRADFTGNHATSGSSANASVPNSKVSPPSSERPTTSSPLPPRTTIPTLQSRVSPDQNPYHLLSSVKVVSPKHEKKDFFKLGEANHKAGKYLVAFTNYEKAAEEQNDLQILLACARRMSQLGYPRKCCLIFDKIFSLIVPKESLALGMIDAIVDGGYLELAKIKAKDLSSKHPSWKLLAGRTMALEKVKTNEIRSIHPSFLSESFENGQILLAMGLPDAAVKEFRKESTENPASIQVYLAIFNVFLLSKNFDRASRVLDLIQEMEPGTDFHSLRELLAFLKLIVFYLGKLMISEALHGTYLARGVDPCFRLRRHRDRSGQCRKLRLHQPPSRRLPALRRKLQVYLLKNPGQNRVSQVRHHPLATSQKSVVTGGSVRGTRGSRSPIQQVFPASHPLRRAAGLGLPRIVEKWRGGGGGPDSPGFAQDF